MTNELAKSVYKKFDDNINTYKKRIGRDNLTYAEKVLCAHADNVSTLGISRGEDYADYRPDRVAMQDATAQMALLQFMTAGLDKVKVPTTVHCDHLILARLGASIDLGVSVETNKEVYDFLSSVSSKYGIGFWRPGSGIIHQVVLENYAFPGLMMIGTDSHTPNAGGLGAIAIGVGGADAVDVMAGWPFNTRVPRIIGVKLTGELSGWAAAKDIILKLAGILTVKGGTGSIVEFFGEGTKTISATGKATICNMGAEIGATCSVFPYDDSMDRYLRSTEREDIADLAKANAHNLVADQDVIENPQNYFDQIIEINLSELEPHLVGPGTPDLDRPISQIAKDVAEQNYPPEISTALVGSCTNSSYEDISRAANIARQASKHGIKVKTPLMVTPGSEQVRATIERDGLLGDLQEIGATVLANACGPCIGQWQRDDLPPGTVNTIVSSYNRNFPKRNDGRAETLNFIGSPETVVAMALFGRLDKDFTKEELIGDNGETFTLEAPTGAELPENGFDPGRKELGYLAPAQDGSKVEVNIDASSERLQKLEPFEPFSQDKYQSLKVLMKAQGKCTTDHISQAGPWLQYRGHLENISGNLFLGANNAFAPEQPGQGIDARNGAQISLPELARTYKQAGIYWIAIGDSNYGEGSSREHAAMEPRFMNGLVILVRSFARIHEANLKKQGMLPITFDNPADYDLIRFDDEIEVCDLENIEPDKQIKVIIKHSDGTKNEIYCNHTMSEEHIVWFKAGSALNILRNK
ncbi:MAG: aconitate hydratase [Acidimicrobiia bacterium]